MSDNITTEMIKKLFESNSNLVKLMPPEGKRKRDCVANDNYWRGFDEIYYRSDEKEVWTISHKTTIVRCKETVCKTRYLKLVNSTLASHYGRHNKSIQTPNRSQQTVITRHLTQQLPQALKQLLTRSLVLMCAIDGRPFNIVNGEGFQYAFEVGVLIGAHFGHFPIGEGLPCPQTIANNIEPLVLEVELALKRKLENLPGIALTMDHYKDKVSQIIYLGITAHYIDQADKKNPLKCCLLKIIEVPDKQDETTQKHLKSVLKEYAIESKYIVVVSDNAMKSTFFEWLKWQSCNAHNMNLVFRHFFFRDDLHKGAKCANYKQEAYYHYDIETLLDFEEGMDEDKLFQLMFERRLSQPEMRHLSSIKFELHKLIRLILLCKKLVRSVKQCNLTGVLTSKLIQELESRWDSNLNMIMSIRKNKSKLQEITHKTIETLVVQIDWDLMDSLIDFLQVLTDIRLSWSFDEKPTLNSVIPSSLFAKSFVKKDVKSEFISSSSDLFNSIYNEKLYFKVTPMCKTACFLSPKDFRSWYDQSFVYSLDFNEDIEQELKTFESYLPNIQLTEPVNRKPSLKAHPKKKQKTVCDFSIPYDETDEDEEEILNNESINETIVDEARHYFLLVTEPEHTTKHWKNTEPLCFWFENQKKFPLLFQAAMFYLAIPATSLASERLFASVWITVTSLRSNLSSQTVSHLQYINRNRELCNISGTARAEILKAVNH